VVILFCEKKSRDSTSTITKTNHTIIVLEELLEGLPIGTNLAMMHVFWALLIGQLLPSRGALFPALKAIGLEDDGVRRCWTQFIVESGKKQL